ncbi:MAG: COG1361 S-layer family protein [Candidatus Woesearchaeota archaeon]
MKKINLIIILGIVLIMTFPMVFAETSSLSANLIRYEPLPAYPGQYLTVYVELENTGNEDASNAAIQVIDSFPFSTVTSSKNIDEIGILKSQQSFVSNFRLRVDSNAIVGINKLKIRYTDDINSNNWIERDLDVEVKNSQSTKLTINQVEISPVEVYPGNQGIISLTIKNSDNIVLRNVAVKLDLETSDLPFIPVTSTTEKQISIMQPNSISELDFPLKVYPTATPGYYKIPLLITFYDDEGNEQEQEDLIGIIISSAPELKIVAEHKTSLNNIHTIDLKAINKGINDLKFLDIILLENENYEIISTNEDYVGDLDSDDYRTASFELTSTNKEFNLMVQTSYKDENNKEYLDNIEVPVKLNEKYTNPKSNISFSSIILILLLIGAGIYIFKLKRKHKN